MAKRRDVETTKISIAITQEDLRTLRARAKRVHDLERLRSFFPGVRVLGV
jgi:hypothetical protein